jgi:hypothetical protein
MPPLAMELIIQVLDVLSYNFEIRTLGAGLIFTVGVLWLWSDFIDATPNEDLRNARRPPR